MKEEDLQSFAGNYSKADFEKIRFNWNGQHGDNFQDSNYAFRMELCEFVIPYLDSVKLELIRDLYIEVAKCSKEMWSIYNKFQLLAQQLLTRGGTNFVIDYLFGAMQSFDSILASGFIKLTVQQKETIYSYIVSRLEFESDDKARILLEFGKTRFNPDGKTR